MPEPTVDAALDAPLSRTAASAAVQDVGWRYLLGTLCASVPVRSLAHAGEVAAAAVAAAGPDADEPGSDEPGDPLIDAAGQLPAIWFQQMDVPRPQRNRIHLDVTVAHDEAEARVRAALAAGGHLVDDSFARSFWVLADAEGNEVCVCTWTDRDGRTF